MELANGLSSSLARGHNGNDLDLFNFVAPEISWIRRAVEFPLPAGAWKDLNDLENVFGVDSVGFQIHWAD